MFSSEQLYISVHIRSTQGAKINLSYIKSHFNLSCGSRCCYRQMLIIMVCWKVVSCCVVHKFLHNNGTLSKKTSHHTCCGKAATLYQHMLWESCHIIPAAEYAIRNKMNTHYGHSGDFLIEQTWFTDK